MRVPIGSSVYPTLGGVRGSRIESEAVGSTQTERLLHISLTADALYASTNSIRLRQTPSDCLRSDPIDCLNAACALAYSSAMILQHVWVV